MKRIKNYHWILLVAIVFFLIFQWFSLETSSSNQKRLDSIKDQHFPILENIDANIVRIDRVKDLYLQAVITAETELIEEADRLVSDTVESLESLKVYPSLQKQVTELIDQLKLYSKISKDVSTRMLEGMQNFSELSSDRMNAELVILQHQIKAFRHFSYNNFIDTLTVSGEAASNLHILSIVIGLVNLVFIGILGFFVASNNRMMKIIEEQNEHLEERVKKRTFELESAQTDLIKSEKMAALGSLVSGVAHEINTPLGVSITAASHLSEEAKTFSTQLNENKIKKSQLKHFTDQILEGVKILEINLFRSAELIKNFKQVAVDQSIEDIRTIDLADYLNDVLSSLRPKWKHTQVEVETEFPENLEITTFPGALAQIVTNLVTNSIKHGYDEGKIPGKIKIKLQQSGNKFLLDYSDFGLGMSQENLQKVFDPFFTTKRGAGGTGLGMHIVFNLVTQKLKGKIDCQSEPDQGCHINIELPEKIL